MSATTARREPGSMTLDEFLAWDGGGHVGKLELWHGLVRAMAPASAVHAMIQLNLARVIGNHLRAHQRQCRAGTEAPIVPPMGKRRNARAPDLSVTRKPPTAEGTFEDPILIIEILSPSNENETWASIESLLGLSSLKEVFVVQSTSIEVELFCRDESGGWPRQGVVSGPGGIIRLASIGLDLPVAEIYEGTHLA